MNLTAPPATMMTQGAAIRPKRRPDSVPISVLQVWVFATHPTPARRATCLCIPGRPAASALSRHHVEPKWVDLSPPVRHLLRPSHRRYAHWKVDSLLLGRAAITPLQFENPLTMLRILAQAILIALA